MRLGYVIRKWRAAEKLGVREAAKQIGTSAATLSRIENGNACDSKTLAAILLWLLAS